MTNINKLNIFEAALCCDRNRSKKYTQHIHIIACLLPILLLWFHYYHVIAYWWMGDDPVILWFTIEKGIFSHFYKPDVWRSFSSANLTPWLQLSFGIDWHLFGLEPSGFYWHHIISFTLVLLAAYRVLTLYFHPVLASYILILFSLSVPSASVVQTLMVRHYLEGFVLALAAYYCYAIADRSNRYCWSFAGAFFYLLAVTAKEIFVPLLVILPTHSIDSGQKKFKMLIPFIFVAGAYVLWRAYMLNFGSILSGYQHIVQPGLVDFLRFPQAAAKTMGWHHLWQKAVVVIGCLSVLITTNKRLFYTYAKLGLWFIVIFIPIVPVICILDARYLFLPAFMIFVFIGDNIKNLWNKKTYRGISRAFVVCLIISLFISMFQTTDSAYCNYSKEIEDRFRKEGEFVLYGSDDQSSLINPVGPPWYYLGLKWLRQNVLHKSLGSSVCFETYFCNMLDHQKGYQYINYALLQVEWPEIKDDFRWVDNTADLFFEMSYASGLLNWSFGPYLQGVYKLVTYDKLNNIFGYSVELHAKNTISLQLQTPLGFILQYESPEGWKTFSPAMILNPVAVDASGAAHIQWQRN
jgi:hypothetical protein